MQHFRNRSEENLVALHEGINSNLAISFGVAAVEKGYTVCFEKIAHLIKLLKTAEIQRKSEYRIRKIMKSSLVVIDLC